MIFRLYWRSLRAPAYRMRIAERFGHTTIKPDRPVIWVHAVSVGETLAAVPLIRSLINKYPGHHMLVTTTTPTGSQQVHGLFSDKVFHVYAPYDLPIAVNRFLDTFKPEAGIIMETEIWPNLFHACKKRKIPLLLANARLSEKSAKGYQRLPSLTQITLKCIHTVAAQTRADADRFRNLGMADDRIVITGSIKFDLRLPASLRESAEVLRRELGVNRKVWVAASTHEGEEELLLDSFEQLLQDMGNLLLIIVPRHPERFDRAAALCNKRQLVTIRRSSGLACDESTQVYLGDTMGELLLLYAAADVVFIGGSLIEHGGHNLLEPAALGVPSVVGPSMYNFEEITSRLLECNGIIQVNDAAQLTSSTEMLLRDANLCSRMGENAATFVENNRGALASLLCLIDGIMTGNRN